MPRLVHLNGPPGIGKSTLARRYIADHPLSFCLDIDAFRSQIGHWDTHAEESGQLARRMALGMVAEHLRSGNDVVVPQFVARPAFVRQLASVAERAGASFYEIVLWDANDATSVRFAARESLIDVIGELPRPVKIDTSIGGADAAYQAVLAALRMQV